MTAEPVTTHQSPSPAQAPPTVRASLSPSRAADFKTCPLLYRFRSIDRLPERTTIEQARGTLVHAVLERLFDLPAPGRTPAAAGDLVAPQWDRMVTEQPELAGIFEGAEPAGPVEFLRSAAGLLEGYFAVEDPTRLEPAERESLISAVVDEELLIRGYLDRLDVAPDGALRVVDYKTGGAPREAFEARALFQLKFYALVLWRTALPARRRGVGLHAGRRGAGPLRAHGGGVVAGDRAGHRQAGFPAPAEPSLRLVQPPGAVPQFRWHAAAVPGRGGRRRSAA
jgi:putative RecB family exonuclease